jgi:hypothetical protein
MSLKISSLVRLLLNIVKFALWAFLECLFSMFSSVSSFRSKFQNVISFFGVIFFIHWYTCQSMSHWIESSIFMLELVEWFWGNESVIVDVGFRYILELILSSVRITRTSKKGNWPSSFISWVNFILECWLFKKFRVLWTKRDLTTTKISSTYRIQIVGNNDDFCNSFSKKLMKILAKIGDNCPCSSRISVWNIDY